MYKKCMRPLFKVNFDGSVRRTRQKDPLDVQAGRTSWMNYLDGSARQTRKMDQADRPARRISSLFLKLWPVCIFYSLYNVTASESDESLVLQGVPKKYAVVFDNNFCYKHARRLRKVGSITSSGVQKTFLYDIWELRYKQIKIGYQISTTKKYWAIQCLEILCPILFS